ncbi:MAG: hypothetical protein QF569_23575 [Candidatus Poribacteria bacterium]|nr:hypothetical protein [Candidatus Poribacteria bacterium]
MTRQVKDDECGAMGGYPYLPKPFYNKEFIIVELIQRLRYEDWKSRQERLWVETEAQGKDPSG